MPPPKCIKTGSYKKKTFWTVVLCLGNVLFGLQHYCEFKTRIMALCISWTPERKPLFSFIYYLRSWVSPIFGATSGAEKCRHDVISSHIVIRERLVVGILIVAVLYSCRESNISFSLKFLGRKICTLLDVPQVYNWLHFTRCSSRYIIDWKPN